MNRYLTTAIKEDLNEKMEKQRWPSRYSRTGAKSILPI